MTLNNIENKESNINSIDNKLNKLGAVENLNTENFLRIQDLYSNIEWKDKENLLFVLNNSLEKWLKNIDFKSTLEKTLNRIETV